MIKFFSRLRFLGVIFGIGLTSLVSNSLVFLHQARMQSNAAVSSNALALPDLGIGASLNGARPFPANNAWNMDVSRFPVHPNSANLIAGIGNNTGLHADFGTFWQGAPIGIPYIVVPGNQPRVPINFTAYGNESDAGPYPVPPNAPIEGGANSSGDRHVLVIDRDNWKLYELYSVFPVNGGASWNAASGAIWDLNSNRLRPLGWTSADATGLPIFPGLVRRDEVVQGEIKHALRFTVAVSRRAYVYPATHQAGSTNSLNAPPMGMRVRLKSTFNVNNFSPNVRVILRAMQKYGMIVADNGSNWYVSGTHDPNWNDSELSALSQVKGSDFEVVQTPNHLLMPVSDFDGDLRTDISVFRPSSGAWYVLRSGNNGFQAQIYGLSTDKLAPGDYDGDGLTDAAVYRSGFWYISNSSNGSNRSEYFGTAEDVPAPADFDGDGKTDPAVFRPSLGTWYILGSKDGFIGVQFGQNGDKPVAADFDGDGKADIAVYRPSTGNWYLLRSQEGFIGVRFGIAEDRPVPADYDGDGRADVAVFRPSAGAWYLQRSRDGFTGLGFGLGTDTPAPADFDGDGKTDIAVFRDGYWYWINSSTNQFQAAQFGQTADKPVSSAFVP